MEDSILTSVKKLLGIAEDYTAFDTDVLIGINSALSVLRQLGVGDRNGVVVDGGAAKWDEVIGDSTKLEFAKTYVYLKVRMAFDPPVSSAAIDNINQQIKELEWRLASNSEVD